MKKLTIVAAALTALASAGIAVAHGIDGAQSVAAVNATFSAAPAAGSSNTRTCTTSTGKTIASTKATYTGTATGTGTTDLTGPVTIAAQSTIDTTDNIGVVNGTLRVGKTEAHFTAVYDHGTIAGTASGHGATPHVQLLGNVSAGFSTTGGFTSGKIGGGTSGGSAVELTAGGCAPSKHVAARVEQRRRSRVRGLVDVDHRRRADVHRPRVAGGEGRRRSTSATEPRSGARSAPSSRSRRRRSTEERGELPPDEAHGLEVRVEQVLEHHPVAARLGVFAQAGSDLVDRADDRSAARMRRPSRRSSCRAGGDRRAAARARAPRRASTR